MLLFNQNVNFVNKEKLDYKIRVNSSLANLY